MQHFSQLHRFLSQAEFTSLRLRPVLVSFPRLRQKSETAVPWSGSPWQHFMVGHMIEHSCSLCRGQETEKEGGAAPPPSLFEGTPLPHSDLTSFSSVLCPKGSTTSPKPHELRAIWAFKAQGSHHERFYPHIFPPKIILILSLSTKELRGARLLFQLKVVKGGKDDWKSLKHLTWESVYRCVYGRQKGGPQICWTCVA